MIIFAVLNYVVIYLKIVMLVTFFRNAVMKFANWDHRSRK